MIVLSWLLAHWPVVTGVTGAVILLWRFSKLAVKVTVSVTDFFRDLRTGLNTITVIATNHLPHLQAEMEAANKSLPPIQDNMERANEHLTEIRDDFRVLTTALLSYHSGRVTKDTE